MKIKNQILVIIFLITSYAFAQGPQWKVYTTQNSGLPVNGIGRIGIDRNNVKWIATGIGGLVKFYNNVWTVYDTSNSGLPSNRIWNLTFDDANNIWLATDSGVVKFDGINWLVYNKRNSQLPDNRVRCVSIDASNVKWFGTGSGLAKYNDSNWVVYNDSNSGLAYNAVNALAIENNIKWIGYHTATVNVGVSKFDNVNWITYNTTNSGLSSNVINNIDVDNNGNKWISTSFGGLSKFNSLQNLWTVFDPSNSGIGSYFILCVIPQEYSKWIGTSGAGLKRFNDSSWMTFNTSNSPIPSDFINGIGIDSSKNVWIGTANGLVVYNPNGIVSVKKNENRIPNSFKLIQNFPNPFNPSTTISYEITKKTLVKLEVFDITGKLISILINKIQQSGNYKINFSSNNLPSGLYLYKITVEKNEDIKKMILLK